MVLPVDDTHTLRLVDERYADQLFAVIERNRAELRIWLAWLDRHTEIGHTRSFIREARRLAAQRQGYHFAILRGDALVGMIGLHQIDWNDATTSIGYWLDRAAWGGGLMTRACRCLTDHAFRALGLNRIEIRCATGNARSRAIPERLGYCQEGTLRQAQWLYDHYVDHVLYAMLAETWKKEHRE